MSRDTDRQRAQFVPERSRALEGPKYQAEHATVSLPAISFKIRHIANMQMVHLDCWGAEVDAAITPRLFAPRCRASRHPRSGSCISASPCRLKKIGQARACPISVSWP